MEEAIFFMGSVTNAMRGKTLLEQNGYRAFIQRNTGAKEQIGCGYSLRVYGDPNRALALLQRAGLKVRGQKRGDAP